MKTVYIMRGLPGSGKTSRTIEIRNRLDPNLRVSIHSADAYMLDKNMRYKFDPKRLGECHAWCQSQFAVMIASGDVDVLFVDNTNTTQNEVAFYYLLARHYEYEINVIDLFDGGCGDDELAYRNLHGVPACKIMQMRENYDLILDWESYND